MNIFNDLYYYIEEIRDPRTQSWPFVSIYSLLTIYSCYFYFIYGFGPRYMKNRPAYSLKTIIRCYDIIQIVVNFLLVKTFFNVTWVQEVVNICSPITYSTDPQTMKMLNGIWWMVVLKIFDLFETIFFVLRKKNRQVSVLHVHHHFMSLLLIWLGIRYMPNGGVIVGIPINCAVHVLMYMYYFLSSLNPTIQKMISPYKPLLTVIQMVQLFGLALYAVVVGFLPNCLYPMFISLLSLFNLIITLYFFYDFYKKSYMRSTKNN